MALRFGLPTSIGGLPFADHATAVEFMLENQPWFPTVPRLRSAGTGLIHQVASFIDGAHVAEPGILELADPDISSNPIESNDLRTLTGSFAGLAEFIAQVRAKHLIESSEFLGVRAGVLGPATTALALRSAGVPLDQALEIGTKISQTIAVALHDELRRAVDGATVAIVLSEPGLVGSMHPTFPLLCGQVHGALVRVVDALDTRHTHGPMLIGAHVPGRTDWATVIASGVSLISVPVGGNLEGAARHLQSFLQAGGAVAWGAVPVDEPLGTTEELLWRRLGAFWCSLVGAGVDPFLLRAQSFVSPSGGLGHFGVSQATNAFALVDALSVRVRRQAAGTRLSLGA